MIVPYGCQGSVGQPRGRKGSCDFLIHTHHLFSSRIITMTLNKLGGGKKNPPIRLPLCQTHRGRVHTLPQVRHRLDSEHIIFGNLHITVFHEVSSWAKRARDGPAVLSDRKRLRTPSLRHATATRLTTFTHTATATSCRNLRIDRYPS